MKMCSQSPQGWIQTLSASFLPLLLCLTSLGATAQPQASELSSDDDNTPHNDIGSETGTDPEAPDNNEETLAPDTFVDDSDDSSENDPDAVPLSTEQHLGGSGETCDARFRCRDGLTCVSETCTPRTKTGHEGGQCFPNDTCFDGLTCGKGRLCQSAQTGSDEDKSVRKKRKRKTKKKRKRKRKRRAKSESDPQRTADIDQAREAFAERNAAAESHLLWKSVFWCGSGCCTFPTTTLLTTIGTGLISLSPQAAIAFFAGALGCAVVGLVGTIIGSVFWLFQSWAEEERLAIDDEIFQKYGVSVDPVNAGGNGDGDATPTDGERDEDESGDFYDY